MKTSNRALLLSLLTLPLLLAKTNANVGTLSTGLTGGAPVKRPTGEIVLSFVGDCTFGTVNGDSSPVRFPVLYQRSGKPDYPFALLRPWFREDDLTITNFEGTLTQAVKTSEKQWHFKGLASYSSLFRAGSVEVAGIANNHSHDYLQAGFDDTVKAFRKAGVATFYQNTPLITRRNGREIVLVGDSTVIGENTTQVDGVADRVRRQIKRYKKPGNIVVVVMHWGSERETVPKPWQQAMGRRFIDAGADAVVGHHPHVLQGIERYKGKYIAYSLGNFAFGGNWLASDPETVVLQLRFRPVKGSMSAGDASIVPCLVTSTKTKNDEGVLQNNYQPKPVTGKEGEAIRQRIQTLSLPLKAGIKRIALSTRPR